MKLILLEMVPTSFGASLAINQLGGSSGSKKSLEDEFSPDFRKLLATSLGALMFSFNIAPTIETQLIGNSLRWGHLIGLVVFSLAVSALMVFFAGFAERGDNDGLLGPHWVETLFAYLVPLPSARIYSGCSPTSISQRRRSWSCLGSSSWATTRHWPARREG